MYITVVIGGILLIVALIGVAMWCCYQAGDDNGYQRRVVEERQQRADEIGRERRAARHARTQPRTSLVVPKPSPLPWYPLPGPGKPQPGRDSGAGTETFAKVPESATGPILKWTVETDALLAAQAVAEEQFRLGLAT